MHAIVDLKPFKSGGNMEQFLSNNKVYKTETEQKIFKEFLRTKDHIYLDNAGAALYSENQIKNVYSELSSNIFANPHAKNTFSKTTQDSVDITRHLILQHFNTNSDEYSVIFTSGATQSIKLVAEHFNYEENGLLAHLQNNHTSVLGMRAYVKKSIEINDSEAFNIFSNTEFKIENKHEYNCLFVYPAQSNFCGTKYPLEWIQSVKSGALNNITNSNPKDWLVLLDCATFLSTNKFDLSKYKPDFVPMSFYKMFGFPTGLGALLVHTSAEKFLNFKYLGGGTVLMALSSKNVMIPRVNLHERFEAGTLPYLSILAIRHGFETFKRLNLSWELISSHTFSLAQYVYKNLLVMHHSNGQPLAKLYHSTIFEHESTQGGIINFNLLRCTGEYIGYSEVLHFANLNGIYLRTGCVCNPGACQKYLNLSVEEVKKHFEAGHICGDQHDLINGYPTGAVRISFGYYSTKEHADKFLGMIKNCFVSEPIVIKIPDTYEVLKSSYEKKFNLIKNGTCVKENSTIKQEPIILFNITSGKTQNNLLDNKGVLKKIFLFPIKSCGACSVNDNWELTATGLKYDRQWMIVNSSGVAITQKQIKKMCMIKPVIDLNKNIMTLHFKGHKSIEMLLENNVSKNIKNNAYLCQSKVCGNKIQGWDCGETVSQWLQEVLNTPDLRLLRQCSVIEEINTRTSKQDYQLSLANKAQFLLINSASIKWLRDKVPNEHFSEDIDSTIHRFRANFVVDFKHAFQEKNYKEFLIDNIKFMSGKECTRCQMICIDQSTGDISKEPLASLSRELKGKISFGMYLNRDTQENTSISIGSDIEGLM
ncbi:unnamed protein product [Brassicogethes aeneus]|uniref:Molybdenum cofactor sulfurase n=1 Tax=Brassicogethes aeneus TaxID=1431903 RepID=A0A9P0BCF1_BRAAE|nr:unnamed protein product [Brassicogethes aeneus]